MKNTFSIELEDGINHEAPIITLNNLHNYIYFENKNYIVDITTGEIHEDYQTVKAFLELTKSQSNSIFNPHGKFPAYKMHMGEYLIKHGHKLVGISQNTKNTDKYVMWFEDTPTLKTCVNVYIAKSKQYRK